MPPTYLTATTDLLLARVRLGLTQKQFAERVPMSTNRYGQIENGSSMTTVATAGKIAAAAGLPVTSVFDVVDRAASGVDGAEDWAETEWPMGAERTGS